MWCNTQEAIRSEFKGTSLTIAHRLNTVMDSDRIVSRLCTTLLDSALWKHMATWAAIPFALSTVPASSLNSATHPVDKKCVVYRTQVVLEAGRVAEQGRPVDMLGNPDGYLARMVAATGDRQAAYLTQLAHGECPETPRSSNEEDDRTDASSNELDPSLQSPMGSQRSSSSWVDVDQSPLSQQHRPARLP